MSFRVKQTLEDGSTVIEDTDNPAVGVILKPGQFDQIAGLPDSEQRQRVREFLAANRADPTGGRTRRDEETMDTARDSSSGEAHQDGERQ